MRVDALGRRRVHFVEPWTEVRVAIPVTDFVPSLVLRPLMELVHDKVGPIPNAGTRVALGPTVDDPEITKGMRIQLLIRAREAEADGGVLHDVTGVIEHHSQPWSQPRINLFFPEVLKKGVSQQGLP